MALWLYLVLILTSVCMSLQAPTGQGPDNDGGLHENMKNFFDSIYRKDTQKSEVLHGVLKHEVEGEQSAFHALRNELQRETRNKHADLKIVSKREIQKNADRTKTRHRGTKGANDTNAEETKSLRLEFDILRQDVRAYDDFLRSVEDRLQDDESQSDPHYEDKETYYADYIAPLPEDQKREYKKKNYDFRMKIFHQVQEVRGIKGPIVNELKNVRAIISGNGTLTEQKKSLTHGINLLRNATLSFSPFISALRSTLARELNRVKKGTTIHTWCPAGTCEYGDDPYRFKDRHHMDWIEVTLHKIEELQNIVPLDNYD